MSHQVLSAVSLSLIKKRARILSRTIGNKSYMQYLDQVAREQFGVRHYHEAQARAKRKQAAGVKTGQAISVATLRMSNYMNSYMSSCQQYYLDI
jgi:hypothetical protein